MTEKTTKHLERAFTLIEQLTTASEWCDSYEQGYVEALWNASKAYHKPQLHGDDSNA